MLTSVAKDHPEVRRVQPTWHCLLRFRQRVKIPLGTDAAIDALRESLDRADITAMTPSWIAGRDRGAQLWAIDGDLAYPLSPGPAGEWIAPTCLTRAR